MLLQIFFWGTLILILQLYKLAFIMFITLSGRCPGSLTLNISAYLCINDFSDIIFLVFKLLLMKKLAFLIINFLKELLDFSLLLFGKHFSYSLSFILSSLNKYLSVMCVFLRTLELRCSIEYRSIFFGLGYLTAAYHFIIAIEVYNFLAFVVSGASHSTVIFRQGSIKSTIS